MVFNYDRTNTFNEEYCYHPINNSAPSSSNSPIESVVEVGVTNSGSGPVHLRKRNAKPRSPVWEDFFKLEKEGKDIATWKRFGVGQGGGYLKLAAQDGAATPK
ncbi:hypothetical protein QJS10_CPB21g01185 [Acorus calamus]|uniref:Uncharacterized protein n=1 Tax=Acorus calamus TaxID=4465 RepID=A0AAV9C557_ACOCL|nr:hypothetical protein QJS10_CPB21g01185 [Acorus calamus]